MRRIPRFSNIGASAYRIEPRLVTTNLSVDARLQGLKIAMDIQCTGFSLSGSARRKTSSNPISVQYTELKLRSAPHTSATLKGPGISNLLKRVPLSWVIFLRTVICFIVSMLMLYYRRSSRHVEIMFTDGLMRLSTLIMHVSQPCVLLSEGKAQVCILSTATF